MSALKESMQTPSDMLSCQANPHVGLSASVCAGIIGRCVVFDVP